MVTVSLGVCAWAYSRGVDCLLLDVQKFSILGLDQLLGGLKGKGGKWMEGKSE